MRLIASERAHRREAKIDTDCTRKVKYNRATLLTATTRDEPCDLQDLFARQNMEKQSKKVRHLCYTDVFNIFIAIRMRAIKN